MQSEWKHRVAVLRLLQRLQYSEGERVEGLANISESAVCLSNVSLQACCLSRLELSEALNITYAFGLLHLP